MNNDELLILKGGEVLSLLAGQEVKLIEIVRSAYETHGRKEDSLPHSVFLRFPDNEKNRIIGLPALLGGEFAVAGIKWIASFPDNHASGLDRASAAIILNSTHTGRPEAILEGSVISAKRTAASAALAAQVLHSNQDETSVGVIGCGLINFEVVRFLRKVFAGITNMVIFDVDASRTQQFKRLVSRGDDRLNVEIVDEVQAVLERCPLVSLATTATQPYIYDLSMCPPAATILHVSLRDLMPEVILSCENIVDDIDHVCRAQTSIHLTEQKVGNRDFVKSEIADVLTGRIQARDDARRTVVFSPFGLGILDLALSKYVVEAAREQGSGTVLRQFLPPSWTEWPHE
ncbi:MAG TPA: 2,3-diaminopropionate biosynthesis protein SbnB [Pyrinomonadaceae bacterium]|nr:2,3-diaminopropionate biosynthesis protein SbnB [Pyrinomonadaceae bacterium]